MNTRYPRVPGVERAEELRYMDNNKPIGIFDSGLGGLTAAGRLASLLPAEDILYLGDTGRVPYGGKGRETIIKYAKQDIEFLLKMDIKAIVVACGTVSTTALDEIAGDYSVPIYGVVEPTVARAARTTKNKKIGIIGTEASIKSGAYERMLKKCPGVELMSRACPLFVPLVENGRVSPGDIVIETVTAEYLAPMKDAGVDTLILGCTHYPLLEPVISAYMGDETTLISAGSATAEFVAEEISRMGLLSDDKRQGVHKYYVSDSTENFSALASVFLRRDIQGEVHKIDWDKF